MDLVLVNEAVSNFISIKSIQNLEQYYNEGIIQRMNLGLFSILWLDNYDKKCKLYKINCTYLKPQHHLLYQKVIDLGFLNNWWNLKRKMLDYDIDNSKI